MGWKIAINGRRWRRQLEIPIEGSPLALEVPAPAGWENDSEWKRKWKIPQKKNYEAKIEMATSSVFFLTGACRQTPTTPKPPPPMRHLCSRYQADVRSRHSHARVHTHARARTHTHHCAHA